MKSKISYEEIEKDIADLNGALKTLKKSASVEKVLNNIIANVRFQTDELRSREEELEKSRTYFQRFFNASPTPLTLIGLDGKRMDCNPAMERLTGRSKKELTNVPVEATYTKDEQALVRKKLVDETIEKGHMYDFETHFKRPDGTKLPIVANCSLLRGKDGEPLFIIYSATDITDITELKRKEEYINSLLYSIPNPTSILDLHGKRIYTSKATEDYFKLPRDKILGAKAEELYDKGDVGKIRENMEKGRHGYTSCETVCTRGDGTKFPAILSFAPVKDKDGNLINVAFSATDVTELREREMNLRSAISNFASVLSGASKGDLTQRTNLSKLSEEYKPIGEDINSMITSFQGMMKTIRSASEEVTDKAERMAMASEETGMAIEEITESVKEVAEEAAKQSEAVLKQADAAMKQASAAEETEVALEEQAKSSEELSTIGQEMLQLSESLLGTLKPFKIESEKGSRKTKV